jgi:hypothetical protein
MGLDTFIGSGKDMRSVSASTRESLMLRTMGTLFLAVLGSLWAAQLGAQQESPPTDLPDSPIEGAVPPNIRILGIAPQISTPQAPLLINPPEASTTTGRTVRRPPSRFSGNPGGSRNKRAGSLF